MPRAAAAHGSARGGELTGMLVASLRDLQWRRRRFAVTAVGTALILTMTVIMSGMSASFDHEAASFINGLGADAYVYSAHGNGPIFGAVPIPESEMFHLASVPGVRSVHPALFSQAPVHNLKVKVVNLFGIEPSDAPQVLTGSRRLASGQALVSDKLGRGVGSTVEIGEHTFKVVGTVHSTILAGIPNVFLTLPDAQAVAFQGAFLANFGLVSGTPTQMPADLALDTPAQATANLVTPMASAKGALVFVAVLLWIVAALIIGSVIYLSVLERTRDFAVFKATGVSNGSLFAGVGLQALIIAFVSAVVGVGLAFVLVPKFPMDVTITPLLAIASPIVAMVVGVLASGIGMRRVATVDPASAFGGP
jgi:putative ABC transport system permease protein